MRTIVKVNIWTYQILYKVGVYIYESESIAIPQTEELNPIAQAVVQAQEWLHLVVEAQNWEESFQQWMEKSWEDQMSDKDHLRASDKRFAVAVAKVAMVEIEGRWLRVSVEFPLDFPQISLGCFLGVK